jgi:hypothetical protein
MIEEITAQEARAMAVETRLFRTGFNTAERKAWNEKEINTIVEKIKDAVRTNPHVTSIPCRFTHEENMNWFIQRGFTVSHVDDARKTRPTLGRSASPYKWEVTWGTNWLVNSETAETRADLSMRTP